ncbi:cellulase family glycosylhydrolase [Flavobacterium soyangense]|uniref:Cellulase family glycosylhydrolase n=1 Tax=Flavobacterium soyangense TaxID=2023265 RepID=A0A930Y072_9FLAO|nr:cellulase family glycosylhydrolase [Flavobacterium soyangense]MBF2708184.1 cellulase family glycosylhydrolase [Flavobacterium soyangense]
MNYIKKIIFILSSSILIITLLYCFSANGVNFNGSGVNLNKRINFKKSNTLISSKLGLSNQICSGINIHFVTGHEKDLDMIAAAGFNFIRMDLVWQSTELVKGNYSWEAYDELISNLEKRGLRAIFILDYSNTLYEPLLIYKDTISGKEKRGMIPPKHMESINGFANWAAAAAQHFKNKNIIWEIWNEPNIISFWLPQPNVVNYSDLAYATSKAIKNVEPNAIVIAPGLAGTTSPFLETFLATGIMGYIDAVSVHPYRDSSPETVDAEYSKIRDLINRNSVSKKNIAIISGEWGYSTYDKGISLNYQAAYIVRMQIHNLISGIPLSIWYDWKNDGTNFAEREHNFGIVMSDLNLKPAYTAIKTMNQQLKGFSVVSRIDSMNNKDYILLFRNRQGKCKIVAWTSESAHSVVIDNKISKKDALTAINGMGGILKLKMENKKLVLDLNELPQYINIPVRVLKE